MSVELSVELSVEGGAGTFLRTSPAARAAWQAEAATRKASTVPQSVSVSCHQASTARHRPSVRRGPSGVGARPNVES
jgi:hypothetical protein